MNLATTKALLFITAIAEIVGRFLPYLWLKEKASVWVLIPAALSLSAFVWLLSLHPTAAGRVYAAYGGVYVAAAINWLWNVDSVRPTNSDLLGIVVHLTMCLFSTTNDPLSRIICK